MITVFYWPSLFYSFQSNSILYCFFNYLLLKVSFRQFQDIISVSLFKMYFQKNSHYGKQTFWEKRYAEYFILQHRNLTEFDWYQDWENLRDIISQFVKPKGKILNVGAGNSILSQDMYKENYRNITNIDFSEIVVDDMQTKYKKENYDASLVCRSRHQLRSISRCSKYEGSILRLNF